MPLDIEKMRADFRERVIHGKCQVQYVIGIPEIEALFAEIDRLRASPFNVAGPGMVTVDPAPHAARAPVITGQVWPIK